MKTTGGIRSLIRAFIKQENENKRFEFLALGRPRGRYTEDQKIYAIQEVYQSGVRATSRILGLHRRTLQRWLRDRGIKVNRYPPWMEEWAERKRRRRCYY